MMKLILTTLALLTTTSVYAASAATPSSQKLENLKDRLASAASQLQQSQKRAIFGTVKTTSVSTITVETSTKNVKIELTDSIKVAQIIKGKRTNLTTDDVSKGDVVVVFGDYDTTLDLLKAKAIFIADALPERLSGTITAVDKKAFTVTVATSDGTSMLVDIETTTKNILWNKDIGTAKGAFSKYAAGDIVFVLETPEKAANRVSAIRVLDIGNPTGAAPTPTPTPTKVATPSATVKTTPKATPTP